MKAKPSFANPKVEYNYPSTIDCETSTFQRVGTGKQTSTRCGQFLGWSGCLNVEEHDHSTLDGIDHTGKIFVKRVFHSCDRPDCPVCFKKGWAIREAGKAECRLKEAQKRFGIAEHIIDSVPIAEYGLPFEKIKANSLKAMAARHYIGGIMIFHAQRFANFAEAVRKGIPAGWRYGPHFHYLDFLEGGYGVCRGCKKSRQECLGCKGFEGVTRRLNLTDGHIVKVKGAQKTIFGTLWYQMNHMTIVKGKIRYHTVIWSGICSYRKLKLQKEDRINRHVCPICGHDLVPLEYVGEGLPAGCQWWLAEFEASYLDELGVPKWREKPKVRLRYE
jgi:hypothetical protein